ncbi:hypothetical protein PR202_gb27753 [Eleusine coracana subsp. coracana]|uniref:Uncharacterized protein n=1 Tax=Eleusine coracana subsp. coracana TaxID=191504 RepID=A0AAV5FV02_ELECO|nr:hypothetical protein PR202_gb27753 [Eleusine coracana subsp. coracana]
MEQWLPLFRNLLASPAPNAAAFSSSPSSGDCPTSSPPAVALLRLLLSPAPTLPPASDEPRAGILFQDPPAFPPVPGPLLPLVLRLPPRPAPSYATSQSGFSLLHLGQYDIWVRRSARRLLDGLPMEEGARSVASDEFIDVFDEPPPWLNEAAARTRPVLPWLPLDCRSVMTSGMHIVDDDRRDGLGRLGLESMVLNQDEGSDMQEAWCIPPPPAPPLGDLVVQRALALQKEIVTVESILDVQRVTKDFQDLCVESRNAEAVLSLVQPWEADDGTLRVLLSNLVLEDDGMHGKGPALVLCSVGLPKLLDLQRPASSVLISAMLDLCKRHPTAAVEAVLFPLVLRKGGLNAPQCEVLTHVVQDCMHPLHVTAFCHRLVSGKEQERRPICMPQHHENINSQLVWTESLFALFYNILNKDICLTPSTSVELISVIHERASQFSRSLKFSNFVLCFVSKCWHECNVQKDLLERAAERTNTVLTKAILAKLSSGPAVDGKVPSDTVTVGNRSYGKVERSMAILDTFISFIQVSMPSSNVIILTDPSSKFSINQGTATLLPIDGDYSRGNLMLQRIKSYIAFLEQKLEDSETVEGFNHFVLTDSDIAVVDNLGHIFKKYPHCHLALTFRNNKGQPLNSGFVAVRGTRNGISKAVAFFKEVFEAYRLKYMKASRMLGDQLALAWVVKSHLPSAFGKFSKHDPFTGEVNGASVLFLPCAVYNWTPPEGAGQFRGMPLDVKV